MLTAWGQVDVRALLGGVVDGVHDLEDVEGELAAGAVRPTGDASPCHVRDAETAGIFFVRVGERNLPPFSGPLSKTNDPAKTVWIGNTQGSVGAVDLDAREMKTTPDIKVDAVRGFGGNVVLHGSNFDEAKAEAERLSAKAETSVRTLKIIRYLEIKQTHPRPVYQAVVTKVKHFGIFFELIVPSLDL